MTSAWQAIRSWLALIRVFNIPIPLAGMLVGGFSASAKLGQHGLVLPVAAVLGCAATQCFNDYEDREVDRQNAGFRPIPSGRLSARAVLIGGHACALAWLLLTAHYSSKAALIVILVHCCTRWYSAAKRVTLAHHLMLPAALGLMPIYGALLVGDEIPTLAWLAGLSIFLIDVNMNIVGAFKDLWDGSAHERVLPVVWGPRLAVAFALAVGLAGVAIQVAAVLAGDRPLTPLVPLALGAALTVHSRVRLLRRPSARVGYAALKSGRLTECLTFPALLLGLTPLDQGLALIGALTCFALLSQSLIAEARLPDAAELELERERR